MAATKSAREVAPLYLPLNRAALMFGYSGEGLLRFHREGRLRLYKIGKKRLVKFAELESLVAMIPPEEGGAA